jgi:phosphate transport system substrate-binding protein
LPSKPIKVIYRSDSSGTSENFTNYLNKSAPAVWTKAKASVFTSSFPGNINSPENLGRIVGASSSTGVILEETNEEVELTWFDIIED